MSSGARAVVASMAAVVPANAAAQARLEVLPSLALSQGYDDNLFSSPVLGERDAVSRAAPRLQLLVRSRRFESRLSYLQEGEWFREQRSLDALDARREGTFELGYDGRHGLRLATVQSYRSTRTPGELLPTTLDLGRFPASQISSAQTLSFPLSARTKGSLSYALVSDSMGHGLGGRSHDFEAGLERELGGRSSLRCEYSWRRFHAGVQDGVSHVFVLGLSRALGRHTQLKAAAGPRVTDGGLERTPEAELELRRTFRRGELALNYARSQLRIIGQIGVASTESAGLRFSRDLVASKLRLSTSPGVFRSRHAAFETMAYRVDSELLWSPARWLSVVGAHAFAVTRGGPLGEVAHNVASLRVQVARPERPLAGRPGAGAAEGER